MELIEKILSEENLQKAIRKVKKNKGAPGVDKMTVQEVEEWFNQYKEDLISKILNKQYKPMPVKRVYIPKPNGKQRPLGIPTVVDRVIQQAMLQVLNEIYEPVFSKHSYGFRPNRSAHMAMEEVLGYLNDGYEWIVDLDIEKFFDTVNHDKLISILRERVNDSKTLHLIRAYLQAGILDKGLVRSSTIGTPQGGPISVILSNIYLDKMDMVMEETMMVKRNSLIFLTAFGLLLTGCGKSGLEITKDDILEVARDDANATKSECENVSIKEQKGSYMVSFNTNGGSYEYKIGKDGIIKERSFKRGAKEETAETEKVEEPVKEETTKKEEKSSTSFDEGQQQAINSALANSGLVQDDVSNITCSLDSNTNQYTVTFVLNDVTTTAVVDAATFTVISTILG